MILIADSGSTKTQWRLIDNEQGIHQFESQGTNPYFQNSEEISGILKEELIPAIQSLILGDELNVFFYGAGCKAEDKKQVVKDALSENFPDASIVVESDLLAAARSVCGHQPGIAAILGTGMNSCFFDGNEIVENKTSLGYILGDEGSGAHLGKTFICHYLNDELPSGLAKRFEERFRLNKEMIIDTVYRKPLPNRFLASFSKFIYQNLKEQFILDMVIGCFNAFFDKHICRYPQHKDVKLSCVGSVAFYYSNILRSVSEDRGVNIDTIVETPIAGLTLYHLEQNS
jgi:N-acetylglucosamine kinase-like BadF-type ATPase